MREDRFDRILKRYGQDAVIFTDGRPTGKRVRAIVRPLRERGTADAVPSPLGRVRQDRHLYLGAPEGELSCHGACAVEIDGERYRPRAAHPIYVGGRLSHWWAILEHRAGEESV